MNATVILLAFLFPLALTLGVWRLIRHARRERETLFAPCLPIAQQLAEKLQFRAPEQSSEPYREGAWVVRGVLESLAVRIFVMPSGVFLLVRLPSRAPWQLTAVEAFQMPGGLFRDEQDKPVRASLLGPGFVARPLEVAEEALEALSPRGREELVAWKVVVDGEATRYVAGHDVDAIAKSICASAQAFAAVDENVVR